MQLQSEVHRFSFWKHCTFLTIQKILTQLAIDDYSVRYFNRIPGESDISKLTSPHSFDLEVYCIISLINGFKRYFEEQLDEIEFLKSNSSKEKRISKVIHNILSVKNY